MPYRNCFFEANQIYTFENNIVYRSDLTDNVVIKATEPA